jgi:hypothetical protein
MEAVLDPNRSGTYTFKADQVPYERLVKSGSEWCTATLGTNKQPAVRLIYETFDDALTASENVTSGERRNYPRYPSSIDNIAGQTVYWKGGGRGPIALTFLINNLFVTIYEGPVDQYAGSDAIRAHEPFVRDQMRRLAAAVVSNHKRRGFN